MIEADLKLLNNYQVLP